MDVAVLGSRREIVRSLLNEAGDAGGQNKGYANMLDS